MLVFIIGAIWGTALIHLGLKPFSDPLHFWAVYLPSMTLVSVAVSKLRKSNFPQKIKRLYFNYREGAKANNFPVSKYGLFGEKYKNKD